MITSNDDIKAVDLINAFPGSENFTIQTIETPSSVSSISTERASAYSKFDLDIYEKRVDEAPYRYLGYYVLQSNNFTKQFKIAALMNTTSQDILPLST